MSNDMIVKASVSAGTTNGFAKRLAAVIGQRSLRQFATLANVSPATLSQYLSGESEPTRPKLIALANAGDVSVGWLATGVGERPTSAESTSDGVAEGQVRYAAGRPEPLGEGFVLVPRYDVQASAGHGLFQEQEMVVDYLAFQESWVRMALGVDPKDLVLITAVGDSMEPVVRSGDLLLVNRAVNAFLDDAIYVLVFGGAVLVKRVQRFFNGAVTIKSDNPAYVEQTLSAGEAEEVHVAGRVCWIARMV